MPLPSTMTPIATTTLSTSASSITFSSIPQNYTDLVVVGIGTNTTAAGLNTTFNSDTGTNYSNTALYGNGSAAASLRQTNEASFIIGRFDNTTIANFICNIQNYNNASTYKTSLTRYDSAAVITAARIALWRSTAAINKITITPATGTINSGSSFTLYGVKAA